MSALAVSVRLLSYRKITYQQKFYLSIHILRGKHTLFSDRVLECLRRGGGTQATETLSEVGYHRKSS